MRQHGPMTVTEHFSRQGRKKVFLPYRLNIDAMGILNTGDSAFSRFASQLKAAVDPNFILAPGRYVPRIKRSEV